MMSVLVLELGRNLVLALVLGKISVLNARFFKVLEHVLRFGKIEVLSALIRYRAPNVRALLIIEHELRRNKRK
jgi:hypothetical protein